MDPIFGARYGTGLYLSSWLVFGSVLAVGLRGDHDWTIALAVFLPLCLVYAFVALSATYLCRAFPLHAATRSTRVVVVLAAAAGVVSLLWSGLGTMWAATLDALLGRDAARELYSAQRPILLVLGALLYLLATAFHYLLGALHASREAETRAVEQTLLAREAELKALRAQVDPHFLFNSLHSISALTTSDAAAARRMCLLLAEFLRETLRLGSSRRIPLAEEWSLAERFLAIEQVRLGPRLRVSGDADPGLAACAVPPLLLQPLVENAVVHGVAQLVEGGTIRMSARRAESALVITVANPCDPDRRQAAGTGVGLSLLRRRLAAEFGLPDAVRTEERAGQFMVEIHLPLAVSTPA